MRNSAIHLVGWCLVLLLAAPAQGHFQLNVNIRVIHIEHLSDGIRVFLRLPTPYVLAQRTGQARTDGTVAPAPFTTNDIVDGQLMHYIDYTQLEDAPGLLGEMVANGHQIISDGNVLTGTVEQVRVHTADDQPPFATLDEARDAFRLVQSQPGADKTFVGDTVTDVVIHYPSPATIYRYTLSSSLVPGLANQDQTANLLLDHFPGGTQIFRASGLLDNPIEVSRSAIAAGLTFVKEGIAHILAGLDHVLFVICLAIGAAALNGLLWRITGFTIGHTVTLSAGFFGLVPDAAWFVPAIELGIALSIIYAAVIALVGRKERSAFLVTSAIGLLHGLGFSFVLQEILQVDSPNLWQSLLAFNIGVEIGQVAIILLVWPVLYLLFRMSAQVGRTIRWVIALPCIAIAALWSGERAFLLWQNL